MKLKKIKIMGAALLFMPLLTPLAIAKTALGSSSNFAIKLFNNSSDKQALYYYVNMNDGKAAQEGLLPVGDSQGKTILVTGMTNKANAEVILVDNKGQTLWDGKISYYGDVGEFNTQTITLDSHYNLTTNSFPKEHAITFNIQ